MQMQNFDIYVIQVETSDNIQQCNMSIYLRAKDAKACRVSSTVLLPLFGDNSRRSPAAVLEVTQFNGNSTSYPMVFHWARHHLEVTPLTVLGWESLRCFREIFVSSRSQLLPSFIACCTFLIFIGNEIYCVGRTVLSCIYQYAAALLLERRRGASHTT